MPIPNKDVSRLLEMIAEHLDIPKSYYEKAAARHRSLGEWLQRKESTLAAFDPDVRPQGSFRFGTVVPPLHEDDEYDLDNVCVLKRLGKTALTQQELKRMYGAEIQGYAKAHNMLSPAEEKDRCWRLPYADEVKFHLDTLPCVPEDEAVVRRVLSLNVPEELARRMVAITDRRHPQYRRISPLWPSSNPRGFARWFELRAALGRTRSFAEGKVRATIEDVPPYEWKTTLQRSIQLLKRHRDVMFLDEPDLAPISMVITNLAARAYTGETDLAAALQNIVAKMPTFVGEERPRVPNPADPAEDYADKWAKDSRLEQNFWAWHAAVVAVVAKLSDLLGRVSLSDEIQRLFRVDLTDQEIRQVRSGGADKGPAVVKPSPTLYIATAPKPWGT